MDQNTKSKVVQHLVGLGVGIVILLIYGAIMKDLQPPAPRPMTMWEIEEQVAPELLGEYEAFYNEEQLGPSNQQLRALSNFYGVPTGC